MTQTITINERDYTGIPASTAIVICLDGSQKEYFEEASKLHLTPNSGTTTDFMYLTNSRFVL